MSDVLTDRILARQKELEALAPEYEAARVAVEAGKESFCARAAELLNEPVPSAEAAMILLGRLSEAARPILSPGLTIARYLSLKQTLAGLRSIAPKS